MTTTIDAATDELIPVRELARERFGTAPHPATVWRWVRQGSRGARLDARICMGKWHTTRLAFGKFLDDQTAAALGDSAPPTIPPRSPEKTAKLKAAGLLK